MASRCRSKSAVRCIDGRPPPRATYANLYGPGSDAEFVKYVALGKRRHEVVHSYSCRQMYLRSYTFTRKEEGLLKRTGKCLGKVRVGLMTGLPERRLTKNNSLCAAFFSFFRGLFGCTMVSDVEEDVLPACRKPRG